MGFGVQGLWGLGILRVVAVETGVSVRMILWGTFRNTMLFRPLHCTPCYLNRATLRGHGSPCAAACGEGWVWVEGSGSLNETDKPSAGL